MTDPERERERDLLRDLLKAAIRVVDAVGVERRDRAIAELRELVDRLAPVLAPVPPEALDAPESSSVRGAR